MTYLAFIARETFGGISNPLRPLVGGIVGKCVLYFDRHAATIPFPPHG